MTAFEQGQRVRQIRFPEKEGAVLTVQGDGWVTVQFDEGGGDFGTGVVDVPSFALELVPPKRCYLFAGQTYYPSPAPGDFVLRGSEEECRAALKKMGLYIVRHDRTNEWIADAVPGYLGELEEPLCFQAQALSLDWWTIVDEDMKLVAEGRSR